MNLIYCIVKPEELTALKNTGTHSPESLTTEGFIHCSFIEQVVKVANKKFEGEKDLSLLQINPEALTAPLHTENTSGGETLFPHVYGSITLTSVIKVLDFPCNKDGKFEKPDI